MDQQKGAQEVKHGLSETQCSISEVERMIDTVYDTLHAQSAARIYDSVESATRLHVTQAIALLLAATLSLVFMKLFAANALFTYLGVGELLFVMGALVGIAFVMPGLVRRRLKATADCVVEENLQTIRKCARLARLGK
jgi:hypothetical protein